MHRAQEVFVNMPSICYLDIRHVILPLLSASSKAPSHSASIFNAALITSVVGIIVSGVVGPQFTSLSTRKANLKQFNRDQAARRREDLRSLFDEAATLLASGVTNLRRIREGVADPAQSNWSSQVFPLGQRLRLRLPRDHEVVHAYDEVRDALIPAASSDVEVIIANFETKRGRFLDLARQLLDTEIPEDGDAA